MVVFHCQSNTSFGRFPDIHSIDLCDRTTSRPSRTRWTIFAAGQTRRIMSKSGVWKGGLSPQRGRSEEHTSELQSLMRSSDAVLCLNKNNRQTAALPFVQPATACYSQRLPTTEQDQPA